MKTSLKDLHDAEDFFHFYQVPYHSRIVMVSRLHILKRFRDYLKQEQLLEADPADPVVWEKQRSFLIQSYTEFVHSSPKQGAPEGMVKQRTSACSGCQLNCLF